MSKNSDTALDMQVITERRKQRHADMYERNMEYLRFHIEDPEVTVHETVILFRKRNKPKIDFYPHTGRWKVCTTGKMLKGGALRFLKWYSKRTS